MAKIRKPLAPPQRPHSARVKPEPEVIECRECNDTGTVFVRHTMYRGGYYRQCPVCTPENEQV